MPSSGMLHCVALVRTGVTSQKMACFIVTAVKTSYLNNGQFGCLSIRRSPNKFMNVKVWEYWLLLTVRLFDAPIFTTLTSLTKTWPLVCKQTTLIELPLLIGEFNANYFVDRGVLRGQYNGSP
jgi:hypothetical protein